MFRRTSTSHLPQFQGPHLAMLIATFLIAACGKNPASNDPAASRGADQDHHSDNPSGMVVFVSDTGGDKVEHEYFVHDTKVEIHLDSKAQTYIADCAHSFFIKLPSGREISLGLPGACEGRPSIDVRQRAIQPPIPNNGPKGMLEGTGWAITQQSPRRQTRECEQRELLLDTGDQCVAIGDFSKTLRDIGLSNICRSVGLGRGLPDMVYQGFPGPNQKGAGSCEYNWQSTQYFMTCCIKAPEHGFTKYLLLSEEDWLDLEHGDTEADRELRLGVRYTTTPFTGATPHAQQHVAISKPFRVPPLGLYSARRESHIEERRPWCHSLRQSLTNYSRRINAPAPENADDLLKDYYGDLVTWHVWYEENIGEVKWHLPTMWTQFVRSTGRSWRDFRESVCLHALKITDENVRIEGLREAVDCTGFEGALQGARMSTYKMEQFECDTWLAAGDPDGSNPY